MLLIDRAASPPSHRLLVHTLCAATIAACFILFAPHPFSSRQMPIDAPAACAPPAATAHQLRGGEHSSSNPGPTGLHELLFAAMLGLLGGAVGAAARFAGDVVLRFRRRYVHTRPLTALLDVALLAALTQLVFAGLAVADGCDTLRCDDGAGNSSTGLLSNQAAASGWIRDGSGNDARAEGCTPSHVLTPGLYDTLLFLFRAPPAALHTTTLLRLATLAFALGSLCYGAPLPGRIRRTVAAACTATLSSVDPAVLAYHLDSHPLPCIAPCIAPCMIPCAAHSGLAASRHRLRCFDGPSGR